MDAVNPSTGSKPVAKQEAPKESRLEEARRLAQEKKPEPEAAEAAVVSVSSRDTRKSDDQSSQKVEASSRDIKQEEEAPKVKQVDVEA